MPDRVAGAVQARAELRRASTIRPLRGVDVAGRGTDAGGRSPPPARLARVSQVRPRPLRRLARRRRSASGLPSSRRPAPRCRRTPRPRRFERPLAGCPCGLARVRPEQDERVRFRGAALSEPVPTSALTVARRRPPRARRTSAPSPRSRPGRPGASRSTSSASLRTRRPITSCRPRDGMHACRLQRLGAGEDESGPPRRRRAPRAAERLDSSGMPSEVGS